MMARHQHRVASPEDFGTLLHYIALPMSLNDYSVFDLCPELWFDIVLPVWASDNSLQHKGEKQCLNERRLKPNVFIEASGSRAYPAHQHGLDLTSGFQVMLQGAKRVVHWPYSERHKLYPVLRSLTTDYQDEVYMAEGVHHRFDLFPAMAETEAWEGTVKEGELLFVPALGIHVFESVGTSFGLRFTHQDHMSVREGRSLLQEGSSTVDLEFVESLEELEPFPPEMNLRELPLLAEKLGCLTQL